MSSLLRKGCLVFICALWLSPVVASETLPEVLQRIHTQQTRQYQYREVRQMDLLEHDWVSTGEMIIAQDQLLISQLTPRSVLISITPSRMIYLDRDSGTRRVRALKKQASMSAFQLLIKLFQADSRIALEQHFQVGLTNQSERWLMRLTPKNDLATRVSSMEISGLHQAGPDHIELFFNDGDTTEWFLSLSAIEADADRALAQSLQQIAK